MERKIGVELRTHDERGVRFLSRGEVFPAPFDAHARDALIEREQKILLATLNRIKGIRTRKHPALPEIAGDEGALRLWAGDGEGWFRVGIVLALILLLLILIEILWKIGPLPWPV